MTHIVVVQIAAVTDGCILKLCAHTNDRRSTKIIHTVPAALTCLCGYQSPEQLRKLEILLPNADLATLYVHACTRDALTKTSR